MPENFQFLAPESLFYIWLPLASAAAAVWGFLRNGKLIKTVFPRYGSLLSTRRRTRFSLVIILSFGLVLAVLAIARPSWNQKEVTVSRKGRDVVFVVDVSRSMLAEDLYPNRLARARLAMLDALAVIDGDRVGLVAFAGSSVIKCPLTLDYSFFRQAVDELSPDSVSVGGSMIGDALRKTMDEVLTDSNGGYRDIILITDGEDQESYPVKAAEMLGENNIRLIAIGLGDENTGKRIPVTDENGEQVFMTYDGREIWSRLDADMLRTMVSRTAGGRYLNVSTGNFDLGEIYSSLINSQEKRFIEDETSIVHDEDFQYFLLPAVILVLVYLFGRLIQVRGRERKS